MKRYLEILGVTMLVVVVFSSCTMVQNLKSAIAMKDCNYSYNSISAVEVGGISAGDGLSFATLTKVVSLLGNASSSIPVSLNVNVDVENPNAVSAGFEEVAYRLALDTIHVTEGVLNEPFMVESGSKKVLPVNVKVDLRKLITKQNGSSIVNLAKNLLGMSTLEVSKLTLYIRPTVRLGNKSTFTTPNYIPLEFEVGTAKE